MVSQTVAVDLPRVTRKVGYWHLTGALVLQVLAVSIALVGLIQGPAWWFALNFTAAFLLVAGAVLRMAGVPRGVVPVIEAALSVMIMTASFGGGTGILGVIPTPATLARWGVYAQQAALSIYGQGTPAESLPEFIFLVVGGACILAVLLDILAIAIRAPAFTALPIVAVMVVPAALLGNGLQPLALASSAAAYLWLLRCDVITRRPGAQRRSVVLSVGASAVLLALLLSGTAPGFDRGGATSFTAGGISIGGTVTPLIDLGNDLRRPVAVRVLTYTTTAPSAQYLKLASLDQFTGAVWKHRERDTKRLPNGASIGAVAGLSPDVKTLKITTSVQIENMQSRWLPVPFPVQSVKGLGGTWSWDPDDLTIGGIDTTTKGQSYSATSLVLQPTAEQLQAAGGVIPAAIQRDLSLPSDMPAIIAQTARTATQRAVGEYAQAVALQDYFRDNGFVYSTQTPLKQGFDGDGAKVIAQFLQAKSGYCVHFASAMALMARTLGIPSRVDEGYLPGTTGGSSVGTSGQYTVTSDDLHAWPELYFAGVGWVAFEPTVGRGVIPAYTRPATSASAPAATSGSGSTQAGKHVGPTGHANLPGASGTSTPSPVQPAVSGLGVAALVVVILLIPAIVRWLRRRHRLRRLGRSSGGAALMWDELRDTARDLGWATPVTETPRAFANRVSAAVAGTPAEDAMPRLLAARERDAYGPGPRLVDAGLADDLSIVIGALQSRAGRAVRVKAALIPVSLLPAGRPFAVSGGRAA